jgi:hypothetical protein
LQEQHLEKQNNHQQFLECLLPIWHKDTFIPERVLEDYSNKAHLSAIAAAIELSKTLQETESQFDHDDSKSDDNYVLAQNSMKAKIVSSNFLKAFPKCPTFTGQVKCSMIPTFVFVHVPLILNFGGKK